MQEDSGSDLGMNWQVVLGLKPVTSSVSGLPGRPCEAPDVLVGVAGQGVQQRVFRCGDRCCGIDQGLRSSGIRIVVGEFGEQSSVFLVADWDEPGRWPGAVCQGVWGGIFFGGARGPAGRRIGLEAS
jgi:hypothetical protein